MNYQDTADALVQRIEALVPTHPEILEMGSAWDLLELHDFKCDDLQPTEFQASWALAKVQQRAAEKRG